MNARKMNSLFSRINLRKIFIICFVIATYVQFKKSSRRYAEIHNESNRAKIYDESSHHLVVRRELAWEPILGHKETIHLPVLAREDKALRVIEAETPDITEKTLRLYRKLSNITFLDISDDNIPPYSTIECRPDLGLRVPNIVHFIWFGPLELKLHQYLSLRSAAAIQKPNVLYLHLDLKNEPTGPYWQRLLNEVPCLEIIRHQPPDEIFGRPIYYLAHKSDILRMEILYNQGGIYVDINVFFIKPMDDLMNNSFVIGKEEEGYYGNSVMLAEPNAPFIREWYGRYTTFLPWQWSEHSTHLPPRIHKEHPELEIYIDKFALMRPNYRDGVDWVLRKNWDLTYNYCVHLYVNTFELQFAPVFAMEEKEMIKINATYGQLVRKALYGTLFFKDERSRLEKVIASYAPVKCDNENLFPSGIPNTLHFIWKYRQKFDYHYYLSIRSAALAFRPSSIVFHILDPEEEVEEPFDLLWVRLNHEVPCITLNRLPSDFGLTEKGYEAESRELNKKLEIALQYGGIVLDLHMITVKNFNPYPESSAVLAWDNNSYSDLVVIGEQNSTILREWSFVVRNGWKNTTDILKQFANEPDSGAAVISNPVQMAEESWYDSNTTDLSSLRAPAFYFGIRFVLNYIKIEETLLQQDTLYGQLVRLIVLGSAEKFQLSVLTRIILAWGYGEQNRLKISGVPNIIESCQTTPDSLL